MYDPKFLVTALFLIALITAVAAPALAGDAGGPDRPVIIGSMPNPAGEDQSGFIPETGDEVITGLEAGDAQSEKKTHSGPRPAKLPLFKPDGSPVRAE